MPETGHRLLYVVAMIRSSARATTERRFETTLRNPGFRLRDCIKDAGVSGYMPGLETVS